MRVAAAREFRRVREAGGNPSRAGRCEHPAEIEARLRLSPGGRRLLHGAVESALLGGRGYARTLAVARTLADLAQSGQIREVDVGEALVLRVG